MNILTIQANYFPMIGGAELFHQQVAEYLIKCGHQVTVVTNIWDKPDIAYQNWQKPEEMINGVKVLRIKPWSYTQYLKTIGAVEPLYHASLNQLNLQKFDLIHCHILPSLIVGALLKRQTQQPLLTTVQGGDLADYKETGSQFSPLLKPIIGWSLKQADAVHVVSQALKTTVEAMGVGRVTVVPNGVDTQLYKPKDRNLLRQKYHFKDSDFIIVSHSRLTPKNGLDILIKTMVNLPLKVKLVLIGSGEIENELKELVKELSVDKRITFLGYQPQSVTADYLSLGDVFARPSRQEGFGISFIEAMATGLPVIGTPVGGIEDIIHPNKDGILVKPDSIDDLTQAITRFIDNPKQGLLMGKKGRIKAIKKYAWEQIGKQMLALITEIVKP
jgi:glycosyltransferase involved in cell wall biosynthesis